MLSEKNARRLFFKIISSVLACAMILNDLSFALAEPTRHLSPPSRFNPIVTVANGIRDEIRITINPEIDSEFMAPKKLFQARVQKNVVYQRLIRPAEMEGVLMEALKNSYDSFIDKFEEIRGKGTYEFSGTITIEAYYADDDIVINIIDNGKPVELYENGDPKYRARDNLAPHLKKHFGGLGIGLFESKQALRTLGGSIKWYPLENGTKTEIRVPKKSLGQEPVIKPNEFITISTQPDRSFMKNAAFRDISILIGKYLRIGISEHTLKRHIKNHLVNLEKFIAGIKGAVPDSERAWSAENDPILKGFAIDELTYNEKENSFLLPLYRNGAKAFIYKYYINGNPKDADMVIPLGDGTDVYVKAEVHPEAATPKPQRKAPAGSIPSVFTLLCDNNITEPENALTAREIADRLGLSYETIKYDLRGLYYHLQLIDKADAQAGGKEARYYVPESVKKNSHEILSALSLFTGSNLRPTNACLELVHELFIRPLFRSPEIAQKDPLTFKRIHDKFEAYFAEITRYCTAMEGEVWMNDPSAFIGRISAYQAMAEAINTNFINNFERFSMAGTPLSNKYMAFNNMVVVMKKDLGAIRFKAERFQQNGEFDVLFRPIRGIEEEIRAFPPNDEKYEELKTLFRAVIDRLETHLLVDIENKLDAQYRYKGKDDFKSKVSWLGDTIEMMKNNLPNIDIEGILTRQFQLARRAEEQLQEIKNGLYAADMRTLISAIGMDHDLELPGFTPANETRRNPAEPSAQSLPESELKTFMCTIEESTPDRQPAEGSPEERFLELIPSQLALMMNTPHLEWGKIEHLTLLANRAWEKLGSRRRVWADETTKIVRVSYIKSESGWGRMPALTRLMDRIGDHYGISEKNKNMAQVLAEQTIFWTATLTLTVPLGSFWATAITWSSFFFLHFVRTKNMPQAPPWYKILAIASINTVALLYCNAFGVPQLLEGFALTAWAHYRLNMAADMQGILPAEALRIRREELFRRIYISNIKRALTPEQRKKMQAFIEFKEGYRKEHPYQNADPGHRFGIFVDSSEYIIAPTVREWGLKPDAHIVDLGGGLGTFGLLMAAVFGYRVTMVEWDPSKVAYAQELLGALVANGLIAPDSVTIKQGDLLREDLSGYDGVYYFMGGAPDNVEHALVDKLREIKEDGVFVLQGHKGFRLFKEPIPGFTNRSTSNELVHCFIRKPAEDLVVPDEAVSPDMTADIFRYLSILWRPASPALTTFTAIATSIFGAAALSMMAAAVKFEDMKITPTNWVLLTQLIGVVIQSRAHTHKRFIPEFPFTPGYVRGIPFTKNVITDRREVRRLAMALNEGMLQGGYKPEIDRRGIPESLELDKCTVFRLGRINIKCFEAKEYYDDKPVAPGESYYKKYILSISRGNTVIGHGIISQYYHVADMLAFRFSIHGNVFTKFLRGIDFSGMGYGKEALALIMAMSLNGGLFEKPFKAFWYNHSRKDEMSTPERAQNFRRMEGLLRKAGYDASLAFSMGSRRKPGSSDMESEISARSTGRTAKETERIKRSLEIVSGIKSRARVVFSMPMYKETARLLPPSWDNPYGEDALRKKVEENETIKAISPNYEWRIIAIDDGTPGGASARTVRMLWNQIQKEYRQKGVRLDPSQVKVIEITPEEKVRLKSRKGGAVLRGLNAALEEGWADYIGYTDVDISTDLRQVGLLLEPLDNGEADVAFGSRRAKGGEAVNVPVSGVISSVLYNWCVRIILPPLRKIKDTQRAFKLFKRNVLQTILPQAKDTSFAFDTELLLLSKLEGFKTSEVGIAWFDSTEAATFNALSNSIKAILQLIKQRAHIFTHRPAAASAEKPGSSDMAKERLGKFVFNIESIRVSLQAVKKVFPAINAQLDMQRDEFNDGIINNLILAYEYLNTLILSGTGLSANSLIELNNIVHYGHNYKLRYEYNSAIVESRKKAQQYVGAMLKWYERHADDSPWKRAAGMYVRILAYPQLFIEGNHRTGALVAAFILVSAGRSPFVLAREYAVEYFNLSTDIKMPKKITSHFGKILKGEWKSERRRFEEFLEKRSDARFLAIEKPVKPGSSDMSSDAAPLKKMVDLALDYANVEFDNPVRWSRKDQRHPVYGDTAYINVTALSTPPETLAPDNGNVVLGSKGYANCVAAAATWLENGRRYLWLTHSFPPWDWAYDRSIKRKISDLMKRHGISDIKVVIHANVRADPEKIASELGLPKSDVAVDIKRRPAGILHSDVAATPEGVVISYPESDDPTVIIRWDSMERVEIPNSRQRPGKTGSSDMEAEQKNAPKEEISFIEINNHEEANPIIKDLAGKTDKKVVLINFDDHEDIESDYAYRNMPRLHCGNWVSYALLENPAIRRYAWERPVWADEIERNSDVFGQMRGWPEHKAAEMNNFSFRQMRSVKGFHTVLDPGEAAIVTIDLDYFSLFHSEPNNTSRSFPSMDLYHHIPSKEEIEYSVIKIVKFLRSIPRIGPVIIARSPNYTHPACIKFTMDMIRKHFAEEGIDVAMPVKAGPSDMTKTENPMEAAGDRVYFKDLVQERFGNRVSIRGLDIGAGTGTKTKWVQDTLKEAFPEVDFKGIDNDPQITAVAARRDNPVERMDIKDALAAQGAASQDIITSFFPYPEDLGRFISASKKLIKNNGLIVIALQPDDMRILSEGGTLRGNIKARDVRAALSDFTIVKMRGETTREGIDVFGGSDIIFVYTPDAAGKKGSISFLIKPGSSDMEAEDREARLEREIETYIRAIQSDFFAALERHGILDVPGDGCKIASRVLARHISERFGIPIGGTNTIRLEIIAGHVRNRNGYHEWVGLYTGRPTPSVYIDARYDIFDPVYKNTIIIEPYQNALERFDIKELRAEFLEDMKAALVSENLSDADIDFGITYLESLISGGEMRGDRLAEIYFDYRSTERTRSGNIEPLGTDIDTKIARAVADMRVIAAKFGRARNLGPGSQLFSFILAFTLVLTPALTPLFVAANAYAQEQTTGLYTNRYPLYETSLPYLKLFQDSSLTNEFYGFTRSYQGDVPTNHTSAIGEYGASSYDLSILGRIELYGNNSNILDTFTTNWELGSDTDNQVFYFGNNYTNDTGEAIQGLPFNFIRILGREENEWWNNWDWSVESGAAAEIINLALDGHRKTGNARYLDLATGLADVLLKLQDSDGGFRMAPIGVYHGSGDRRFFWNLKSTEKNERILSALENLYAATNADRFAQAATNLKGWFKSMYDPQEHLFHAAATYNGSEWIKSPLGTTNEYYAADVTAMAPLEWMFQDTFFGATQAARDAEVAAMFDATDTRLAFKNAAGEPIFYRFSGSQTGDYGSAEFTAQMAVALLRAAQNYSQRDPERCAQYLWRYQQLVMSLQNTFFKPAAQDPSARVAPYASYVDGSRAGGVPTGTGYNTEYYEAAAASVWFSFALSGFNPEKADGGAGIPLTNPVITGIKADTNADMLITMKDPPGALHYDIYFKTNMLEPFWHLAESDYPVSGSGTTQWRDDGTYTGTHPGQAGTRFYRVGIASNDLNKVTTYTFSNVVKSAGSAQKPLKPGSSDMEGPERPGIATSVEVTIDEKGRIAIPARFADDVQAPFYLFCKSYDHCIGIYPKNEFEAKVRPLMGVSMADTKGRDMLRAIGANSAFIAAIGPSRRFMIPDHMLRSIGITSNKLLISKKDGKLEFRPSPAPSATAIPGGKPGSSDMEEPDRKFSPETQKLFIQALNNFVRQIDKMPELQLKNMEKAIIKNMGQLDGDADISTAMNAIVDIWVRLAKIAAEPPEIYDERIRLLAEDVFAPSRIIDEAMHEKDVALLLKYIDVAGNANITTLGRIRQEIGNRTALNTGSKEMQWLIDFRLFESGGKLDAAIKLKLARLLSAAEQKPGSSDMEAGNKKTSAPSSTEALSKIVFRLASELPINEQRKAMELSAESGMWPIENGQNASTDQEPDAMVAYMDGMPVAVYSFIVSGNGAAAGDVRSNGIYVKNDGKFRRQRIGTRLRNELYDYLKTRGYNRFIINDVAETKEAQRFQEALANSKGAKILRNEDMMIKDVTIDLRQFEYIPLSRDNTVLRNAEEKRRVEPFDYETFVIDARTGSRTPAMIRESDGDGLIECQIDGERAGAFAHFTTHSESTPGRAALIVTNLKVRESDRRDKKNERDFEYVGTRLLQAAVKLSMLDTETRGAMRLTTNESNKNAQAFYDTFADLGLKSRGNPADKSITYYLERQDAQRFIDGVDARLSARKPEAPGATERAPATAEEVFRGIYDTVNSEEPILAAKMVDELGIGKADNVLCIGPANVSHHPVACSVNGASTDVCQPETYNGYTQRRHLKELIEADKARIASVYGQAFAKRMGSIDTDRYVGIAEEVDLPAGHYSYVFLLNVFEIVKEKGRLSLVRAMLSSMKNNATILISSTFNINENIATLKGMAEKLGYDIEIGRTFEAHEPVRELKVKRLQVNAVPRALSADGGIQLSLNILAENAARRARDLNASEDITMGHRSIAQMVPAEFLTDPKNVDVTAKPSDPLVRQLMDRIRRGDISDADRKPIRIDVKSGARISIYDGMHRIAALRALGVKEIPTLVIYYDKASAEMLPFENINQVPAGSEPVKALLNGGITDTGEALNSLSDDYYEKIKSQPLTYQPAGYADVFMAIRDTTGFDGKDMLEVGPAHGLFMYALKKYAERAQLKFSVTGLELNASQAERARTVGGLNIITGSIEDVPQALQGKRYDCVFVRYPYFEVGGIHNLKEYLLGCYKMTKPGGLCIIDTNVAYSSLTYREHIMKACRDSGFEVTAKKDFVNGLLLIMKKSPDRPAKPASSDMEDLGNRVSPSGMAPDTKPEGSLARAIMTINAKFRKGAFSKAAFQEKRINPDTGKPFSDTTIYSELNGLIAVGILGMKEESGTAHSYSLTDTYLRAPPPVKHSITTYLKTLPARPLAKDLLAGARIYVEALLRQVEKNTITVKMEPGTNQDKKGKALEIQQLYSPVFDRLNGMILVRDGYDWTRTISENNAYPVVFHGTSSLFLDDIRKHGLDPNRNPVSAEDDALIRALENKLGEHYYRSANYERAEQLSLTLNLCVANNHAEAGPEVLERVLSLLDDLRSRDELSGKEDQRTIAKLRGKYKAMLQAHLPVVLVIKTKFSGDHSDADVKMLHNGELLKKALTKIREWQKGAAIDLHKLDGVPFEIADTARQNPTLPMNEVIEISVRDRNYAVHTNKVLPQEILGIIPMGNDRVIPQGNSLQTQIEPASAGVSPAGMAPSVRTSANLSSFEVPAGSVADTKVLPGSGSLLDLHVRKDVTPKFPNSSSERIEAIRFTDIIKLVKAANVSQPVILALGTNWIKGYKRGTPHYNDLNRLISAIRNYCAMRGIVFVNTDDEGLLAAIEKERKAAPNAKVIVLAGKESIAPEKAILAPLRNDENAFLAAVDSSELDETCYVRLAEMLRLALELGLKDLFRDKIDLTNPNINIGAMKDFRNVYVFLPHAERIKSYDDLRALYRVQEFA